MAIATTDSELNDVQPLSLEEVETLIRALDALEEIEGDVVTIVELRGYCNEALEEMS